MHGKTTRDLTASERIRLARKRVAEARREDARVRQIVARRESYDITRMMRENRSVGL